MSKVDSTIKIGSFTLKNRITMAPTVKFDYTDDSGLVTDKLVEHYEKRAKGGAGLICVEATAVLPGGRFGKNHMGLWDDSQIEGHKRITEACHKFGSVVIIQLNHIGCGAHPEIGPSVGPSDMEYEMWGHKVVTHGFTTDELHDMQKAFADAAVRAQKAGYDGVQLHGCHGYLINQFISVNNNKRNDEYGGSPENRARFASEIISEIREKCGKDFLISVRTTGCEPTVEDAISVGEEYVKAGCDYLQVSTGMTSLDSLPDYPDSEIDKTNSLGVYFKKHFDGRVPVSCVGGIKTAEKVRHILENDLCDTVDIARELLADPEFANAVIQEKEYKICYGCKACQYGPFTKHMYPCGNTP